MSVEDNKAFARRIYKAINAGNLDLFDELISEGFVEHEVLPGLPTIGPEAPKAVLGMFRAAFPDIQFTADDMIGEGDKVVVRGTVSGTHKGEFMGMPPTNKSFKINFIDILEIHDSQGTAHWGMTDQAAMMEQLGLAPQM